jgi:pilus assembly protein FimV
MWRCLKRISLALVFFVSGEVLAVGLGEIELDSALNEPLRAEIELLSATPDELANLTVALASADTFERYGIDRPFFLQEVQFQIVKSGGTEGNYVRLTSASPITEPFLTFLVEANWARGRLLREYTVLLDPPTYAPPAVQQAPAVQAPSRSAPTDSGRIERQPEPRPAAPAPRTTPAYTEPAYEEPKPMPVQDDTPYDTAAGGDYYVQRGETLWGLASRLRPDSRLTMNQTMLAIFEANPEAFGGNINILRAGASLRIPSADEIYRISRGEALSEVQRQHDAWGGYTPPAPVETDTSPSLVLVPPDDDDLGLGYDDEFDTDAVEMTREEEIEARIADIEASDAPDQQSLIEIRNSELADLRRELANLRGEVYEPPVDDFEDATFVDEMDEAPVDDLDDLFPDADEIMGDDTVAGEDELADDDEAAPPVRPTPPPEKSLVDTIIDTVSNYWMAVIGAVVVIVGGILFLFMRRGRDDIDDSGPWQQLDEGDLATGALSGTESMRAPTPADDDAIVVVEQESGIQPLDEDTIETPAADLSAATDETGEFGSLEDTFSSETAVNLDQQDPLAEADFHMAYGLYDQAADLVSGALETDPNDRSLLAKLCEIYFVWGNRDAFVDAASRLKAAVGDGDAPDWDKIVIMGQQIAGDHAMFAGASAAGATKAVDLSFEDGGDATGALDMDFGGEAEEEAVDFMFGEDDLGETAEAGGLDLDLEKTAETPTIESPMDTQVTAEMPAPSTDATAESPTIEQQFEDFGTAELPSIDEDELGAAIEESGQAAEATAEINLDDLGLDVGDLADTSLADDLEDIADITGKNPEIDPDATGAMRLAPDETGASPMLSAETETDVGLDMDLLEATGRTQVLSDELAVDTGMHEAITDSDATMLAPGAGDDDAAATTSDDDATMLAPGFGDDEEAEGSDFDFAKTEALPADVFTGDENLDETSEIPAVAETDVDLDLDDLTAALKVSQAGDTVDMPRDDATVEQPRPVIPGPAESEEGPTVSLGPEDMSDDLNEARTMTEVGTKLDLARAYVDMGDPAGARSILEEVLDEGDESQRQQAQQLLDSLPS